LKPILVIAAVAVITAIAGFILLFAPSTPVTQSSEFSIEYTRTGGIAGMNEKFVIETDGTASFTSNIRKPWKEKLDAPVFGDLKGFVSRNIDKVPETMIKPVPGAADYFTYAMAVKANGKSYNFSWVDEGAAQTKIPETLSLIQSRVVIVQESLIK